MAVSLAACGGSDDVVVDITTDNAAAIAAATPAIVASAEAAEFADMVASVNAAVGSALDATTATGDDVIAAIQGAVDITATFESSKLLAIATYWRSFAKSIVIFCTGFHSSTDMLQPYERFLGYDLHV